MTELLRGTSGACACGHPLGAASAMRAFADGGNAVDAAVAAAFTLSVALPEACGLGGESMMLLARPGEDDVAYNGAGRAPLRMAAPVPADGGGTVAVPAAAAAWLLALEHHGRLGPEDVLADARRLARDGVPTAVGTIEALAEQRPRLERRAPGFAFLRPGLRAGDVVRQPELARVLDRLAAEGVAALHTGDLAEAVARAVRSDGGAMEAADLAMHATTLTRPLHARRLGFDLAVQPPSSQAVLCPMALGAVEALAPEPGVARTHVEIEALEAAFASRDLLGDRRVAEALLGEELEVDPERAARRGGPRAYSHTTAVTTADAGGAVVSMLISVFDDFGSAVLVPEGGFLLNSRLLGFTAEPNDARPGATPVSTLSPVIASDGDRRFALATPGADGQVQTLVQLLGHVAQGASLTTALARPRFRAQEGRVLLEASHAPIAGELAARGHDVDLRPDGDALFGAAATAGADLRTGTLFAAADPRRETTAEVR